MTLTFKCKGHLPKTKEEIIYTVDIPADSDYPEHFRTLLKDGKLTAEQTNDKLIIALKHLSWFKNIIFDCVLEITEKQQYAYMVMLIWSTEDDDGTDYYLYYDYDSAKDRYDSLIADEKCPEISWIGDEAFDENGDVNENFEFNFKQAPEPEDLYWTVSDRNNSKRFTSITLTKIRIK